MSKLIPKYQHSGKFEEKSDNTRILNYSVPIVPKERYTPKITLLQKYANKPQPQVQMSSDNRTEYLKKRGNNVGRDKQRQVREQKAKLQVGNIAALAGIAGAQLIPGLNTAINIGLGLNSAAHLLSDEGIKKTVGAIYDGDYVTATQSGAGDLMDLGLIGLGTKSVKVAPRLLYSAGKWVYNKGFDAYHNTFGLGRPNGKFVIEPQGNNSYNINEVTTLYRANPVNPKNTTIYYGDESGRYIGKWFTDNPEKPLWYASNYMKLPVKADAVTYHRTTVPTYWAEKQRASRLISNPNIEFEPEDFILEDGIKGTESTTLSGKPGLISYLLQTPKFNSNHSRTSLAFFEKLLTNINKNNLKTLSYNYKNVGNKDIVSLFFNNLKIQGKTVSVDGNINSYSSRKLGENAKNNLIHNTIERNIDEMRNLGYSENEINLYKQKTIDELNNVRVGHYTAEDYSKANMGESGGFYNPDDNFISVNTESKFPIDFIEAHEGRHMLDFKTNTMPHLDILLSDAYDNDFINIPNTKYAGSIKGYQNMNRERITTNRDARETLLKGFNKESRHIQNLVIDKSSDDLIFKAVENANGYGRRYILFLRDNNALTHLKALLFKEAMKHVGIITGISFGIANQNK